MLKSNLEESRQLTWKQVDEKNEVTRMNLNIK